MGTVTKPWRETMSAEEREVIEWELDEENLLPELDFN